MEVTLDEVVVRATRPLMPSAPPGATVMTAADIERATALDLGELLAGQAGARLRAYGGTGRNAAVDIRGMGDTAVSNVLVIVDGVRLNEADLSGPDLASLRLADLERVEIRRGLGGVRHGDGAVGGVVEIATRAARKGPAGGELSLLAGSFATFDLQGRAHLAGDTLAAALSARRRVSDGYRENEDSRALDLGLDLGWTPAAMPDAPSLRARVNQHHDVTGLPGPVSASAFATSEAARRASSSPFDESDNRTHRHVLSLTAGTVASGRWEANLGWRDRDNPFLIGYTPLKTRAQQEGLIRSEGWDAALVWRREPGGGPRPPRLAAGADWRAADYTRLENGQYVLDSSTRRLGEMSAAGLFAESALPLGETLTVSAGLRAERFASDESDARYTRDDCQTTLVEVNPGVFLPVLTGCVDAYRIQNTNHGRWWNRAAELGLAWQPHARLSAFATAARHFRGPNVDELLLAADDLRPQHGHTLQAGLRWRPDQELELAATLFGMRVEDEIHYDASGLGVNRNYDDRTRRDGLELELAWRPRPELALRANLSLLKPVFAGSGADIPHVPRRAMNAELAWSPRPGAQWVLSARHTGRRPDGNDLDNTLYPPLPSHTVWDTALRLPWHGLRLSLGIQNLLDEAYAELGYSASYYPMPGRNLHLTLQGDF